MAAAQEGARNFAASTALSCRRPMLSSGPAACGPASVACGTAHGVWQADYLVCSGLERFGEAPEAQWVLRLEEHGGIVLDTSQELCGATRRPGPFVRLVGWGYCAPAAAAERRHPTLADNQSTRRLVALVRTRSRSEDQGECHRHLRRYVHALQPTVTQAAKGTSIIPLTWCCCCPGTAALRWSRGMFGSGRVAGGLDRSCVGAGFTPVLANRAGVQLMGPMKCASPAQGMKTKQSWVPCL